MSSPLLRLSSILLVALVACDDNDRSDAESVGPLPIPDSDTDYIDNLVPHHQEAIEMADVEIAKGTRPDVRDMAQQMKTVQAQEIEEMQRIRARVAGSERVDPMRDPHASQDLARLQAATGAQVDTLFLENMIPHHAGAVSLSHRALENLSDPELRDLAETSIVAQAREMNEMLDMLGR